MDNNQQQGNEMSGNQQNGSGGVKFGKGFKQPADNRLDKSTDSQSANIWQSTPNQKPDGQQNYQAQSGVQSSNQVDRQAYEQNYKPSYSQSHDQAYNISNSYSDTSESPHKNMFELYIDLWRKYAVFKGCISRRDYWMTILANVCISLPLFILCKLSGVYFPQFVGIMNFIYEVYTLAIFIPGLALCTRRLHDTGRSGHWQWLLLTLYGGFVVLAFACQKSKYENNKYRN